MTRDQPTSRTYFQNFELETSRLMEIDAAQINSSVPHLADWTVHAVLAHTAQVLRYGTQCLASETGELPKRSSIETPPAGDAIIGWFRTSVQLAHEALATTDPDATRPTWAGPQTASWYLRRLTHEVSVHRWDAQAALTEPDPIATDLAIDGIDELLEVYVPNRLQVSKLGGGGNTVHLHATDSDDGEWFLTYGKDVLHWEHLHAKGDVAARGTASDLLLMLWGRLSTFQLEVFGDRSLLDRWQQVANF